VSTSIKKPGPLKNIVIGESVPLVKGSLESNV